MMKGNFLISIAKKALPLQRNSQCTHKAEQQPLGVAAVFRLEEVLVDAEANDRQGHSHYRTPLV